MSLHLFLEQSLNGVQLGLLLFLITSGMTLLLGTMNLLNIAYGALYMLGAYFVLTLQRLTGSLALAVPLALLCTAGVAIGTEMLVVRRLYARDHLDQVLCTLGLNLVFNEAVAMIWGRVPLRAGVPPWLDGSVHLLAGLDYPLYRLVVIGIGLAVAGLLFLLIEHTRIGMRIRAGAADRDMVVALGVDVGPLFTLIFALGAACAGLAGLAAAPLISVSVGMGDSVLILCLVVIVIGGIGSVRGALLGSVVVGCIDTWGRILLPATLASFSIYLLMVLVLLWRPRGLLPAAGVTT